MSAETAETEENVLPANLVKLASQELHDRAYELHEAASEALDSDQWPEYTRLSDQASKYDEEIDRRGDAARKAVAVEAPKNPVQRRSGSMPPASRSPKPRRPWSGSSTSSRGATHPHRRAKRPRK